MNKHNTGLWIHTQKDQFGWWTAVTEGYYDLPEPGIKPMGQGSTEQQAIRHLHQLLNLNEKEN